MITGETLDRGREAFDRLHWSDAYAELSAADSESPLAPEDLERMATSAYLTGRDTDSTDLWGRAHQEFLARGESARAARSASTNGESKMSASARPIAASRATP